MRVRHDRKCDCAGRNARQDGGVDDMDLLKAAKATERIGLQETWRVRHRQSAARMKACPGAFDALDKAQWLQAGL